MNAVKKKCTDDQPMFKFDPETGRYVPLPAKWLLPKVEKTASSNSKRKIELTPLKLSDLEGMTLSALKSPNKPAKLRKTDSVRKGLFNVPPTSRPHPERRSVSRRSINKTRKVQKKKNPCELSPLLDMEEVEEELLHKNVFLKGYPFRTPSKPTIKFTEQIKSPLARKVKLEGKNTPKKDTIDKTPESTSSNENEFLELEKMCGIDESGKENDQSPISSVCNLLEGTVLGSTKKQSTNNNYVTNIQVAIRHIEDLLKENKKALDEYKTSHEENLYKIVEILDIDRAEYKTLITTQETNRKKVENILNGLKNFTCEDETENKENRRHNRRSERLLNKSPIQKGKQKIIISPVILKSGDLRKTTLTKNLVAKTQQYQIQSPRIQKALDMYNSMRGDISILATPKLDRKTLLESPKSSNMSRLLSRRVQSQCLLLQDTPIHK